MSTDISKQKRESVKKNYDLIAQQYSAEFGTYIEDLDVYEELIKNKKVNTKLKKYDKRCGKSNRNENTSNRKWWKNRNKRAFKENIIRIIKICWCSFPQKVYAMTIPIKFDTKNDLMYNLFVEIYIFIKF